MRLVIQRVSEAKVTIQNQVLGAIQKGLVVLLGIHKADKPEVIPWFINKLVNLRIFGDKEGKMNLSIKDIKGQILLISQFTLYGNCLTGRRPDFIQAATPAMALPLYHQFIEQLRQQVEVQTGQFGAIMQVSLVNDGPVTFIVDPKRTF